MLQEVYERMIIEAAVHAAENERVDVADGLHSVNGGLLGGGNRVVIELNAAECADILQAMW